MPNRPRALFDSMLYHLFMRTLRRYPQTWQKNQKNRQESSRVWRVTAEGIRATASWRMPKLLKVAQARGLKDELLI